MSNQFKDMIVPRNLKVRDGKAAERLAETVRILKLKGMVVSNKALRSYIIWVWRENSWNINVLKNN